MKRLFYLTLGVAAGAYARHRLARAAHAWTPAGVAGSAASLRSAVREMADEVAARAAERESQLRRELDLEQSFADIRRVGEHATEPPQDGQVSQPL